MKGGLIMPGELFVVATPIGNLKDITLNALEVLKAVDLIAAEDTRVSIKLLNHYQIKKPLISYHKFNEKKQTKSIIAMLKQGKKVAIITDAGTPCLSDPGSILVKSAIDNNIKVLGIGGMNAAIVGLSVSGFNISSFTFYGFVPRKDNDIKALLATINHDSAPLAVLYEAPKRIMNTLIKIKQHLHDPYLCVGNDLTKKFARKYYGLCSEVIDKLKQHKNYELGEYVIIINKRPNILPKDKPSYSIEADLIDVLIKEQVTLKEAITRVTKKRKRGVTKKEVYQASLNLKDILLKAKDTS